MYEDDSHLLMDDRALEQAEELKRGDGCDECGEEYLPDLHGDNEWTLICSKCGFERDLVQYVIDNQGSGCDD